MIDKGKIPSEYFAPPNIYRARGDNAANKNVAGVKNNEM